MSRVTIVIPFYNDPYIVQAVESALSQTHPDIEIIVVDDGSVSHSELLVPYLNRVYYVGKANGGTASALNTGFRLASGEYIAWLSSDDLFYPQKVELQLKAMKARGAQISHTAFNVIDGNGQVTQLAVRPAGGSKANVYREFAYGNPVNGCTVMMSKRLFTAVGGFNEQLPYTHDLDFWYRAMLAGYRLDYVDEALTAYRMHAAMGTVLHRPAIQQEVQRTMARYRVRWARRLKKLGIRN